MDKIFINSFVVFFHLHGLFYLKSLFITKLLPPNVILEEFTEMTDDVIFVMIKFQIFNNFSHL